MKRLLSFLMLLCLAAVPMFAAPQFGASQRGWEVVRADYGSGNRWVDVTERVRSLVQNDGLNFRVDNNTLGGDPFPGESKTLRLQLRDSQGRDQQATFQENDWVRFGAHSRNQSSLQITRAVYGAGNRWADVTSRLNSQIQGNQLHMQVTNDNMGGDPARNQSKSLRVDYTFDGRANQVVINEGDTLQLNSGMGGNGQGRLQVTRAVYGAGNRWADVTDRLNSQIRGNQLHLQVTNDNMGGDPARNQSKALRVDYTFDGRANQVVINEGDTLQLNSSTAGNWGNSQGSLRITRAVYGAGNRWADVTNRLNSQVRGDRLDLQVTNNTMGGDPAQNQSKSLRVDYTFDGRANQVVINEGDTLRLNSGMGGNYQSSLQITRAVYGAGNRWADVTNRLNSQVRGDRLDLQVTNNTMGGDPAQNQSKSLRVDYTFDGRANQVVINEGDTLRLNSGASQSSQSIRCESDYDNRKYCPVDTRGGVRLARQLSSAACNQGSTWGYDNSGIWVNNGCRADFDVASSASGSASSQTLRCESENGVRKYCRADTGGGVRLSRQISEADCIQGSTWGYTSRGVWVSNNCRADFEVLADGQSTGESIYTLIPSGTQLSVVTNEIIDSRTAGEGQRFSAQVDSDVVDSWGNVAIPRGSLAELAIRRAATDGNNLTLDVDSVTVAGTRYLVSTGDLTQKGGQGLGANKKTAIMVGGGAALGTLIGAIAGGGKGAAIGAAVGAGAGVGGVVLTRGKQVSVPAETVLNFRLDQDLSLVSRN
jgi:vacuolar-type H+-ATPase subunit E/Vma4